MFYQANLYQFRYDFNHEFSSETVHKFPNHTNVTKTKKNQLKFSKMNFLLFLYMFFNNQIMSRSEVCRSKLNLLQNYYKYKKNNKTIR